MKVFFKRAEENELRMKFENGNVTEATIHYKDSYGVKCGIEELKRRTLYKPEEIADGADFQEMSAEEITALLGACPELKEKAKLNVELLRMFKTLPEERQSIVIDHIKDKYPAVATALEQIRDEDAYFSAFGDMVVVEERQEA